MLSEQRCRFLVVTEAGELVGCCPTYWRARGLAYRVAAEQREAPFVILDHGEAIEHVRFAGWPLQRRKPPGVDGFEAGLAG